MKPRLWAIVKVVLAGGLLAYLIIGIHPSQLALVLRSCDLRYIGALFVGMFADLALRSANWRLLLRTRGARLPLLQTMRHYIVGGFLGSVIPTSLGTDVGRAYQVAHRHPVSTEDVSLAIVVLNLMGLLAVCLQALVGAGLMLHLGMKTTVLWGMVPIALAYIALFPLLLGGWVPDARRPVFSRVGKVVATLADFSVALRRFRSDRAAMAKVLAIALATQVLGALLYWATARALGGGAPFVCFLALVPMMTLSRLIPASVAGFGAEQGVFVLLFAEVGLPAATSFLVSLTLSLVSATFVLAGGLIYAFEQARGLRRPAA